MNMENLKKAVGFGLSVGEAVFEASEKPSLLGKAASVLHLLEDVPVLFGIDYSQLAGEAKDLTPEELIELNSYIDTNFSIDDADKEKKIEAAISVVIDLAKVAEKIFSIWKPKAEEVAPAAVIEAATPAS